MTKPEPKPKQHPFYQFCEELREKTQHYRIPPMLFRGQSNGAIESGLYRKLAGGLASEETVSPIIIKEETVSPIIIKEEIDDLIDACKLRESSYPAIKNSSDFDLLAEIQHMGGKTPFIDFTFSALTALYFACKSNDGDGEVFAIYPFRHENIELLRVGKKSTWKNIANTPIYHLFYWQPPRINQRIIKQDSVFVFNRAGKINDNDIAFSIKIAAGHKAIIRDELKQLAHIDFDAIYPDFLGYIQGGTMSNRQFHPNER